MQTTIDRATGRPGTETTSVIDKVVRLLRAFDTGDELTLTELSQRTELPKSTVHRLIGVLTEQRLLQQRGKRYSMGLLLFELGASVHIQGQLREIAVPFLEDLYEATHEIVHLGVRDGLEVLYVEKLSGHRRASSPSRIGGRMPLHCTGLGKALLAFSPASVVGSVLERPLSRVTGYSITSPAVLGEELKEIRRTGVAYDREEAKVGLACAAAPVLDASGVAIAAISVSGPCHRVDPQRLASGVKTAARGLQRALGPVDVRV